MSKFLTELEIKLSEKSDKIWIIQKPLIYESDLVGVIFVPSKFQTDLASVPRIFRPAFGQIAHREAVIHDYLFTIDCVPQVPYYMTQRVFLEAMALREKPVYIRYPMFWAVCSMGWTVWKKHKVMDERE